MYSSTARRTLGRQRQLLQLSTGVITQTSFHGFCSFVFRTEPARAASGATTPKHVPPKAKFEKKKKTNFGHRRLPQLLQRLRWTDNGEKMSKPDCDLYCWTDHPDRQDALHYWYEIFAGVSQSVEFLLGVDVRSSHRLCVHIWR